MTWNQRRPDAPKCVLQDWVMEHSLAIQGTLLTVVRGPDNTPKVSPAKEITKALRFTFMNNAHGGERHLVNPPDVREDFVDPTTRPGPTDGDTFMGDWTGMASEDARRTFFKDHDQYPHHWLMHLIHCAQIVGYLHPDPKIRGWWSSLYCDFCGAFHMGYEFEEDMLYRLRERT